MCNCHHEPTCALISLTQVFFALQYDPDDVEEHEFAIVNESPVSAYVGALYFPTNRMATFERWGMLSADAGSAPPLLLFWGPTQTHTHRVLSTALAPFRGHFLPPLSSSFRLPAHFDVLLLQKLFSLSCHGVCVQLQGFRALACVLA